jgi:hypothetical protein
MLQPLANALVSYGRDCCHVNDRPITRVIAMSQDLPAAPAERPDAPDDGAGPSGAPTTARRGQPDTSSPGEAALVALVKLIARQAAEQNFKSQG